MMTHFALERESEGRALHDGSKAELLRLQRSVSAKLPVSFALRKENAFLLGSYSGPRFRPLRPRQLDKLLTSSDGTPAMEAERVGPQ